MLLVRYVVTFNCKLMLLKMRFKVRLVQKVDTGKIYALKLLKKDEMLKNGQVCTFFCSEIIFSKITSLHMSDPKETFLQNLIPLGSSNFFTRFKTPHIFILSWNFFPVVTS